LINSRLGLSSATPFGYCRLDLHLIGAHLLPKLRWHFAEFLSWSSLNRLGILSLPTCVGLRYGQHIYSLSRFSRKRGICGFSALQLIVLGSQIIMHADLPTCTTYCLEPGLPSPGPHNLLRHHIGLTHICRYRNINLFTIDYAFRPRLRIRLTHRGSPCRWKP